MDRVPLAASVFTWPDDQPSLIGERCDACSAVRFPVTGTCARCGSQALTNELLPRRGTLWTFTTQEFLPKEPYASGETAETFRPYGVGLVDLEGVVRVEARLTEGSADRLAIGMQVELQVVPFRTEDDGTEVVTFAFAPVGDGQEG